MAHEGSLLNKKGKISLFKLYDRLMTVYKSRNKSEFGILRPDNFYIDFKGFYSGRDRVSYLYTIDDLPVVNNVSFHTMLRSVCQEGVSINFIDDYENSRIKWKDPALISRIRTFKKIDEEQEEVDAYNFYESIDTMDRSTWLKSSLEYLSIADKRRGRRLLRSRKIMIVSGVRGTEFDTTIEELESLCKDTYGIEITRILYDIPEYIQVFSPFRNSGNRKIFNGVGSNVFTDEIAARFVTCSQGIIGIKGQYWGTDIHSRTAVMKPTKATTEKAENWLISGETGSGKSCFIKGVQGQLLASPDYMGTIMDIEGFEYLAWAKLLAEEGVEKVVVLNMAEGQGKYFDPVEIVMTGDRKLDEEMFTLAKNFTMANLKTLAGVSESNPHSDWINSIIKKVVGKFYKDIGVTDDMETWANSQGYDLFDLYNRIKLYEPKNGEEAIALDKCLDNLSVYFEEDGLYRNMLKEKVSVKDIVDAKLLLCSFGLAGKSENSIDQVQLALMQQCAAQMSHLRSIFGKLQGKFNFKIWEEFQRWGNFPDSDKTLGVALTGGRKLGDINIVITNKLIDLLTNDRMGIMDNITTYAIGGIADAQTRELFCERKNIPDMVDELGMIAKNNKDLTGYTRGDNVVSSPYQYSFLLGLDNAKFATVKMELPEELAQTELFRTGVDKSDEGVM